MLRAGGLDYEPEPWTPVDSLAWLKAMAWDLRGNMDDEIDRVLALADHTPAEVAELYPPYPYDRNAPIVRQGAVVDGVFEQDATRPATRLPQRPAYAEARGTFRRRGPGSSDLPALIGRGDGIGSNTWVVDGEHSATGEPLLANDPHLGVTLPGIWYQMGLHCRTVDDDCPFDVTGFTFSGVPGRDHRPQRRHRLGVHQPRPRRHRPLPRAGGRRPVAVRRAAAAAGRPHGDDPACADGEDVELHRPVDRGTARCSPTSPTTWPRSGRTRRPTIRPRDGGDEYAVSLAWTALEPSRRRRTRSSR